ncbi:MAG: YdcF family protein [Bacteroidaceae bacterium]|nr:YdcF family protein [Bacteroidaceae bacterium]
MTISLGLLAIVGLIGLVIAVCNTIIVATTRKYTFNSPSSVPSTYWGIVLGTAPIRSDGKPNRYFVRRIRAAVELFQAGKVERIIVSGGSRLNGYDEAKAMRNSLERKGIPASVIVEDNGGQRTLLSVLALKHRFGADCAVFISQRFHNERAIFMARQLGIEAYGYNAEDVHGGKAPIVMAREWIGRVRAFEILFLKQNHTH